MTPPQGRPDEQAVPSRLHSWKEIAAYLARDARTVQRWEKTEGLPVHRHLHESQSSVYAHPVELDEWLANRARPSPEAESIPLNPHRTRFRSALGIALVLTVALLNSGSHHPVPHFQERDWVLLEGFENRTGDPLFDGTLKGALQRELSNSDFMSVAPQERIEDILRLMGKPLDLRLDRPQAREVALRDGSLRTLVMGRIEMVGSTYLVSAEVIDPLDNRTLGADTETAGGKEEIWPAIRRLSNWVRATLGETMDRIQRSNQQLERVTTPSLRALQLFTEADAASKRLEWDVSAQLSRQALLEDPDFASAHLWLAWALRNLGDPGWEEQAQLALNLSAAVSERERYFILGSYELMKGHTVQALPALEALVRRYPDHYFAYGNLVNCYIRLGRFQEAADTEARFADLRPNDPIGNARATVFFTTVDLGRARHYAERSRQLAPDESTWGPVQGFVDLFPIHDLWMKDDAKGALAELDRLAERIQTEPLNARMRRGLNVGIADFYLALGKFKSAQQWFDKVQDKGPGVGSAWVSFFKGDEDQARQSAALIQPQEGRPLEPKPAFLVARLRPLGAGEKLSVGQPEMRGEIALSQGQLTKAIAILQEDFDRQLRRHSDTAQWTADSLVTALEGSGNSQKGLEVLELTSATRPWSSPDVVSYAVFWLRNQARLSAYYHHLGRKQESRKIDDQLRKLLAVADPDHPILRQLAGQ
jgi:tetratricopeptide (TPR) repeat protein